MVGGGRRFVEKRASDAATELANKLLDLALAHSEEKWVVGTLNSQLTKITVNGIENDVIIRGQPAFPVTPALKIANGLYYVEGTQPRFTSIDGGRPDVWIIVDRGTDFAVQKLGDTLIGGFNPYQILGVSKDDVHKLHVKFGSDETFILVAAEEFIENDKNVSDVFLSGIYNGTIKDGVPFSTEYTTDSTILKLHWAVLGDWKIDNDLHSLNFNVKDSGSKLFDLATLDINHEDVADPENLTETDPENKISLYPPRPKFFDKNSQEVTSLTLNSYYEWDGVYGDPFTIRTDGEDCNPRKKWGKVITDGKGKHFLEVRVIGDFIDSVDSLIPPSFKIGNTSINQFLTPPIIFTPTDGIFVFSNKDETEFNIDYISFYAIEAKRLAYIEELKSRFWAATIINQVVTIGSQGCTSSEGFQDYGYMSSFFEYRGNSYTTVTLVDSVFDTFSSDPIHEGISSASVNVGSPSKAFTCSDRFSYSPCVGFTGGGCVPSTQTRNSVFARTTGYFSLWTEPTPLPAPPPYGDPFNPLVIQGNYTSIGAWTIAGNRADKLRLNENTEGCTGSYAIIPTPGSNAGFIIGPSNYQAWDNIGGGDILLSPGILEFFHFEVESDPVLGTIFYGTSKVEGGVYSTNSGMSVTNIDNQRSVCYAVTTPMISTKTLNNVLLIEHLGKDTESMQKLITFKQTNTQSALTTTVDATLTGDAVWFDAQPTGEEWQLFGHQEIVYISQTLETAVNANISAVVGAFRSVDQTKKASAYQSQEGVLYNKDYLTTDVQLILGDIPLAITDKIVVIPGADATTNSFDLFRSVDSRKVNGYKEGDLDKVQSFVYNETDGKLKLGKVGTGEAQGETKDFVISAKKIKRILG